MARLTASLVLLALVAPLYGQSPKGIPMSSYVDQIRTQFEDMNRTATGKPVPMSVRKLHLELEVASEVDADGTLNFFVVEAGKAREDVITHKLSFDVHLGPDSTRPQSTPGFENGSPRAPSPGRGGLRPGLQNKAEFMRLWATETQEGRQDIAREISTYLQDVFGLTLWQLADALPKGVPHSTIGPEDQRRSNQ